MRNYRRFTVINGRRLKRVLIKGTLVGAVGLAIIGGQGIFRFIGEKVSEPVLLQLIGMGLPAAAGESNFMQHTKDLLLGFDVQNPISMLQSQFGVVSAAPEEVEAEEPPQQEQTPPENSSPIKAITVNQSPGGLTEAEGVLVKNNTTYGFDPAALLNEPLNFDLKEDGPQILIVQSHSSESYTPSDRNYYLPTDPDRTEDINFNVVRVGKELADTLTAAGFEVIHDETIHDYPSYNSSYKNSLATVESYLQQYPSIKIVLDVHRDAMVQADGTKLKVVTEEDGQQAAQVMIVTGSDQGGLSHPNWRENLKFAMKLQRRINLHYPTLTRPINFTKERYNTHTTSASIILEMGSNGNTLEEALTCAKMVGTAMADMLQYIE
jgi:stage II sporulation protein P